MTKTGLAILHYIVPVAALADWFLFDEKGKTTWKMPLFAASFPLSYLAISLIAAQFMTGENRYPYHFINVDELGAGAVALNVVLVSAAFLAFGYLGVWIDHRLEKRIAQKNIEKE